MHPRNETLPCLVCGERLFQSMPDEPDPDGGVLCTTTGNYGSTVFDPFDGERIRFNLCDKCLIAAGEAGRVVSGHPVQPVVHDDGDGERWTVGHITLDDPGDVPWTAGLPARDTPVIGLEVEELDNPPTDVVLTIDGTVKKYLQQRNRDDG